MVYWRKEEVRILLRTECFLTLHLNSWQLKRQEHNYIGQYTFFPFDDLQNIYTHASFALSILPKKTFYQVIFLSKIAGSIDSSVLKIVDVSIDQQLAMESTLSYLQLLQVRYERVHICIYSKLYVYNATFGLKMKLKIKTCL